MREESPTMSAVVDDAFSSVLDKHEFDALMKSPLGDACRRLSQIVDQENSAGPSYHNSAHFKEAVLASAFISNAEFKGAFERTRLIGLAVLSMIGHDLGHDGTRNDPESGKHLETDAWNAVAPVLSEAGVSAADSAIVRSVILGTEDRLFPENRARYKSELPQGELGPVVDALRLVANEADLAGSLLPGFGNRLGELLADEWNAAGIPMGATVSSWKGRLGFLSFAATASDGAKIIGLEDERAAQVKAFSVLAERHGLSSPSEAAERLDLLAAQNPSSARDVYVSALAEVSPELANVAFPPFPAVSAKIAERRFFSVSAPKSDDLTSSPSSRAL